MKSNDPFAARLLKLKDAAAYCGLPARNFRKHIGIAPIKLGPHELWDRVKLDALIDALQSSVPQARVSDWADAIRKF